ncbi:MAG: RelA/SpoT domain-containing protein [Flavobacteriaceae bacterium]|nr:RelA/SpoT domain-containing protein [Flavobacteriaceae bacterium]
MNKKKVISNKEIDRLGDRIRQESPNLSNITLESLQQYRSSHEESLSKIFNILCEIKRNINNSSIASFRIKRFESIIGKLKRYPKMKFNRMWDIGGCRCILNSEKEIYKLREEIGKVLDIRKEYDYIKKPQEEGYKSLHLFVSLKNDDKVIEIQLRNKFFHNWATLVEITDLLFEAKLKEYKDDKTLLRFHFLLSKNELVLGEKKEFAKIVSSYNYFEKLSEVFSRNYLKVREQWTGINTSHRHKYYLIETSKDQVPIITAYERYKDAESHYFESFKKNSKANIVLTHLPKASYQQISLAYSNYILTVHDFFDKSLGIIENLVIESLKKGKIIDFYRYYILYNKIVFGHFDNIINEIHFSNEIFASIISKKKRKRRNKKNREWSIDIKNQVKNLISKYNSISDKLRETLSTNWGYKFIFRKIARSIEKKYEKELRVKITSKNL